jgi:hypothetical protein
MPNGDSSEEWKAVVAVMQQFNDLLMRLRSFGVPIVATLAGAGFALGLRAQITDIPIWVCGACSTSMAAVLWLMIPFLLRRPGWGDSADGSGKPPTGFWNRLRWYVWGPTGQERLDPCLHLWEKAMWYVPVMLSTGFTLAYWVLVLRGNFELSEKHTFSAAPLVLFFALAVLTALYVLDRFYYYKLLLGAVRRAVELEQALGYKMTETITVLTSPGQSAIAVTLLYFLPGTVAYLFLLVTVVFHPGVLGPAP